MRTNLCSNCGVPFQTQTWFKSNVCEACVAPKEFGFPTLIETLSLHTMANVSKARLAEIDRRICLKEERSAGFPEVGRKDRGKITDRQIDLRP